MICPDLLVCHILGLSIIALAPEPFAFSSNPTLFASMTVWGTAHNGIERALPQADGSFLGLSS